MSFRYINNISKRLQKTNTGYINTEIIQSKNIITVDLCYESYKIYHAEIIVKPGNTLFIDIPYSNNDFAYIYLHAIITIQMILNKVTTSPLKLIDNFIEFASQFDLNKNKYEYSDIMNSGLFNLKYNNGDCEINSAFLIHLLNKDSDIIEFKDSTNSNSISILKKDLYPWNLNQNNKYITFKIMVYLLFMKFIIGNRLLLGNKLNFDKNIMPYECEKFASFGDDYYYKENPFIDLTYAFHSFIIGYDINVDKYNIYDLNRPDYKLFIYQYEKETFNSNETFFNIIECDEHLENLNSSHYIAATQTGHVMEYVDSTIKIDGKEDENVKIALSFNQFKYLLIAYITLEIYKMCGGIKSGKIDIDVADIILYRISYLPTGIDYDKLNQMLISV